MEVFKARLVLDGHWDREKASLDHISTALRHCSVRILMLLRWFWIWCMVCGCNASTYTVRTEFEVQCIHSTRDDWTSCRRATPSHDITIRSHRIRWLLVGNTDWPPQEGSKEGHIAWWFNNIFQKRMWEIGRHVGRLRGWITKSRHALTLRFHKGNIIFIVHKTSITPPFNFTGLEISGTKTEVRLSQEHYVKWLLYLKKNGSFDSLRSFRAKVPWVVHSRPDIACEVSMSTQLTESKVSFTSIDAGNKIVEHLHRHSI